MSWKQVEKPKTVIANAGLIREFTEMEPAPYDRPMSEKRLQVYERILKSGEFRPVTWASVVCAETGTTYRVNGKHTATLLSGFVKAEKPIPEFHVTVERYECETLNDVAKLYNTFDSNLSSRTTSDINAAFAATIPELRETPLRLINLCVTALSSQKWSEAEIKKVPPAERAEELLDNHDFVTWLSTILTNTSGGASNVCKPLLRSAVVSAMVATYRRGPRIAQDFWTMVRDETAPNRDDPTRVLARFLLRAVMASGKGDTRSEEKKIVGQREMYAKCIHAWNAWRNNERTSLNYHAKAPLPSPVK